MGEKSKICALITARSGSKRLPNKNIRAIYGRPLIKWTIDAAIGSNRFDKIFCYTDDKVVSSLSAAAGAEVPFERPRFVSQDSTSSVETIKHFLLQLKQYSSYYPDWLVLLQPTSPLRTADHIRESLDLIVNVGSDSLISVKRINPPCKKVRLISNGRLGFLEDQFPGYSGGLSIESGLYVANGAIYIINVKCLYRYNSLSTPNTIPFLMGELESIDIDTLEDFMIAEYLLEVNDGLN